MAHDYFTANCGQHEGVSLVWLHIMDVLLKLTHNIQKVEPFSFGHYEDANTLGIRKEGAVKAQDSETDSSSSGNESSLTNSSSFENVIFLYKIKFKKS